MFSATLHLLGHLFVKADCIQLMYSPDEWDVPLGLKLLSVCFWGGGGGW